MPSSLARKRARTVARTINAGRESLLAEEHGNVVGRVVGRDEIENLIVVEISRREEGRPAAGGEDARVLESALTGTQSEGDVVGIVQRLARRL